jgi:hypothetical protein
MGRIQETMVRSGFRNQPFGRSEIGIAHCENLVQRNHTAKADVDELEILHDEVIELYCGPIIASGYL